MKLLLDIGNARIKWVMQGDGNWQPGEPLPHEGKAFKDVARPAWKDLEAPSRVLVSNVRGDDYARSVRTWVKRRWKVTPEFLLSEASACGVTNAYTSPQRLGPDRWASLIAINARYKLPAIVIDFGTAITIDAINTEGKHLGGLIIPGIELMKASLTGMAPGIQITDDETPQQSLLAQSTEAAVSGGVMYAAISLVDRISLDLKAELGASTTTIITGGDAGRIQPLLSDKVSLDADLVLKGLSVFAEETACAT